MSNERFPIVRDECDPCTEELWNAVRPALDNSLDLTGVLIYGTGGDYGKECYEEWTKLFYNPALIP